MESKITTRRAEITLQLHNALQDLLASIELNAKYEQERADSELEIEKILNSNQTLKSQLAQLHSDLIDVSAERDKFRNLLDSLDQYYRTHESSLQIISALDQQLLEANQIIQQLKDQKTEEDTEKTFSLYHELVGQNQNSAVQQPNPIIIDLTSDQKSTPLLKTRKYIKKSRKINKAIIKTQKRIQKLNICPTPENKKFEDSARLLQEMTEEYQNTVTDLELKILRLEIELQDVVTKYSWTEKKQIVELNKIILDSNTNLRRVLELSQQTQQCIHENCQICESQQNTTAPTEELTIVALDTGDTPPAESEVDPLHQPRACLSAPPQPASPRIKYTASDQQLAPSDDTDAAAEPETDPLHQPRVCPLTAHMVTSDQQLAPSDVTAELTRAPPPLTPQPAAAHQRQCQEPDSPATTCTATPPAGT